MRKFFLIRNNIPNLTQHRRKTRSRPGLKSGLAEKMILVKILKSIKVPGKWILKIQ